MREYFKEIAFFFEHITERLVTKRKYEILSGTVEKVKDSEKFYTWVCNEHKIIENKRKTHLIQCVLVRKLTTTEILNLQQKKLKTYTKYYGMQLKKLGTTNITRFVTSQFVITLQGLHKN